MITSRPSDIRVILGVYNVDEFDPEFTKEHNVSEVIVHNRYDGTVFRYDIAILNLTPDVNYSQLIQPACIWTQGSNLLARQNITGSAVGWGLTEENVWSPILKEVMLPFVDFDDCLESNRDTFGQSLYTTNFCAGYRNGKQCLK